MKEEIHTWAQTNKEVCALLRQAHDMLALSSLPGGSLKRKWVGLTPEEIDSLANLKVDGAYLSVPDTIRQADAKLKEKNT